MPRNEKRFYSTVVDAVHKRKEREKRFTVERSKSPKTGYRLEDPTTESQ